MANRTDTSSPDHVGVGVVAAVAPSLFIVGFVSGFVVLVFSPTLYRRLRYGKKHFCKLCCYFTPWSRRQESTTIATIKPKPQAARYYTEIDEETIPRDFPSKTAKVQLKYDDVVTMKDEHRYSNIESKGEKYEDVSPQTQKPVNSPTESQPIYYILEPTTYKRLPARLYSEMETEIDNNVYFVLEPDTNNVKPTFQKPQRNTTNTYFILEPESFLSESFDAEAYAISDLDSSHAYFVLEKYF